MSNWVAPPSSTAPAIGPDGTIYVHCNGEASTVSIERLHAITPGGVITWTFEFNGGLGIFTSRVQSSPAVASDGTIYVGSMDTNLYALNPDGTVKWARSPNLCSTSSSPAVAPDGTIYFVNSSTRLYAYAPDGTFKWSYLLADSPVGTGNDQSPTVGPDGTVYVGSPADHRLYAIWPDGTLRWRFLTGWGIRSTPSIGADGTVYVGSDGLYALNPDGTQKWKFGNPLFSSASPVIGADGTIYWRVGLYLYAVDPHGTQKWMLRDQGFFGSRLDSTPALTSDWTLYVPTCQGLSAYWAPPNAPAVTPTLRPSCPDPYEPNNGFASAWPLTPGSYQSYICCRISWPGIDYDYFKFYANVGDRIEVRLTNLPDNYDLHLYAPDQTLVGFSMNSGKSNEFIGHTAQQTGHYYVKVWGSGCECSPSSPYTLQIALNPPTPTPTSTPSS